MFVQSKVVAALEGNAERFIEFQQGNEEHIGDFRQHIEAVAALSRQELEDALRHDQHPGALPTSEQHSGGRPTISFEPKWQNHEQARAWALETLRGRPTFAVDGSQIMPQRSLSVPVALVQIGWFENPHEAGVDYEKDVSVEVLTPQDLSHGQAGDSLGISDTPVGLRRYQGEAQRISAYLRKHAGNTRRPVAFFDGSLVASWAERLSDAQDRSAYVAAILDMLEASQSSGVPLVAYVDTSYARDLGAMVATLRDITAPHVDDAVLLNTCNMQWGDRTPAHICARRGTVLDQYKADGVDWSRQVAFVYLKTTAQLPPARLEFPLWMVEAGILDDVLNIVRGEVIVGMGYPYALETADAVAALTMEDGERFGQTFQEFARRQNLRLRFSRKAQSKRQRRT